MERANEALRDWKRRNPSFAKRKRLKPYGLTPADYDAMLEAQSGACAICRKPFIGNGQVDHCHDTGHVRGLLCSHCNLGIGNLRHSVEIMKAAIDYLQPPSSPSVN
jgi:Recombination endonuclease VII